VYGALHALFAVIPDPEHVIYVGTASKTLAPGLRLGWLSVPGSRLRRRWSAPTWRGCAWAAIQRAPRHGLAGWA
jgi:aspartate/methionine/tyrosine aminotransferase